MVRILGTHGRRRCLSAASLATTATLVVLFAAPAAGTPVAQSTAEASGWSFEAAPYLWLPEMEGTVRVGGLSAAVDVDFDKLFDLLFDGELLAGALHVEAHRGPFSFFVDAFGGGAKPSKATARGKATVTLNFAFVEFGPTYRLLDLPVSGPGSRSILLDVLVGGRFMYFYQSISFRGSRGRVDAAADASTDWVDPFVGGRWLVPLTGGLDILFRGDIGGFDLGSELAWNLIGGFQYELPWQLAGARTSFVAAYKAFDFDYETGSGRRQRSLALNMRGPLLGVTFVF